MKTVVTSTFKTYILELRREAKGSYKNILESTYRNGFFRAVLDENVNQTYLNRLNKIDEDTEENVLDLVDTLNQAEYSEGSKQVKEQEVVVKEVVTPEEVAAQPKKPIRKSHKPKGE